MEELRLYEGLVVHPWLASPEQQALLEGVELSGPPYVASSSETSAGGLKAAVACVRPAESVDLFSGSQAIAARPAVAASTHPSINDAAGASAVTACVGGECGAGALGGKHPAHMHRQAFTECVLVTFQWAGKPQALHVLREQGSETRSGAFVARHLGRLEVAASACQSERLKSERWVSFARKWQSKSGSASSWLTASAEVRLLIEHGTITSAAGMTPRRLLQVQVALKELERLCVGQHEDVLSLREALVTAQPASAAVDQQRLAEDLAGSAFMPGMCPQRTDQATPDSPAALAHPSPLPLQLPALQQVLSSGETPSPGAAAMSKVTQEEAASAPLTMSAALAGAHGHNVGPHGEGLSQRATVGKPSCREAAGAADLQCHEALASLEHETRELLPGKGKSRPRCAPDYLVRQAGERKGRCARKQHRSQAGRGAASTAGSSEDAGAVAAATPAAQGERLLGKGKSRPQGKRAVPPPNQRPAAEGRQHSHEQAHRVSSDDVDAKETTSAEAARARLQSWTRKQGLAKPAAAEQTAGQAQAAAKGSAAADEGAKRSLKRQPYAEALLAIPRQLASCTKRSFEAVAAPEQTGHRPKKRTRHDTFSPTETGAESEGAQTEEQLTPTVVTGSTHAQSGGQLTPTLAEDSTEAYSTCMADRISKQRHTIRRQNAEIARLKEAWQRDMVCEMEACLEVQQQLSHMMHKYVLLLCRLSDNEA